MKRLLLAGVSLSVTACGMSSTPPSTAQNTTFSGPKSQYILALTATPECTLWRYVDGKRACLDGTVVSAEPVDAIPVGTKQRAKPALTQAESRVTRGAGQDASDAAFAPMPRVQTAEIAMEAPAPVPRTVAGNSTLFEEMRRIGMLDGSARVTGTPTRAAAGQVASATELPRLPGLPMAIPEAVEPAPALAQAFAPEIAPVQPAPRQAPAPKTLTAVSKSWQPVDAPKTPAASPVALPGQVQLAAADKMNAAPITPVEKAPLPSVRGDTVVPLAITEKATEDKPAVVRPALPATTIAAAPPPTPELPPLPNLPALPNATTSAPQSRPAMAQPVMAAPPPPPPPAPRMVAQPVSAPMPAAKITAPAAAAPAMTAPASKAAAAPMKQAPKAAPAATKVSAIKPAAGMAPSSLTQGHPPGQSTPGRYLVLHSFRDHAQAMRAATRYNQLGAKVASAQINGQTWHRVVVRDGATERSRLAADGVRGYWPVTL